MKIKKIHAIEVIDSRGNPTIEVEVTSENCQFGRAIVPSGASTGEREACELRDNDKSRFHGKGVLQAVKNVNKIIGPAIIENNFLITDQKGIDNFMIALDGTPFKTKLGANAILGVSMAVVKLAAKLTCQPLYRYLGGVNSHILPTPMLNILNGGVHANNAIDFQEFMIVPVGAPNIKEAIRYAAEIYASLKDILKEHKFSTLIGDEGGFAPNCSSTEEALDLLLEAIKKAGYVPSTDCNNKKAISLALDVAASELFVKEGAHKNKYYFKKLSKFKNEEIYKTQEEMLCFYEKIVDKYPIISIEDPFDENDWDGFIKITKRLGNKIQIVGDDLFVTNTHYIQKGIEQKAANSVLIKVNQIGTITETINAIEMAQNNNWTAIISHRSGETEDVTIADIAVALNTGQIKTGSMARTDRIAKYNQLIRINEKLGKNACFLGGKSFKK